MKKKRFLCIVLSISVLFMLMPLAVFAESDELRTEYNSKTHVLTVELPYSPGDNAWLIAASYNEDNSIEDVKVIVVSTDDDTTIEVSELTPAYRYKAFLLNKNEAKPIYSSGAGTTKYDELVVAKGTVFVPEIDGAVAHATSMAVDAYVEADTAKENALSLFADTNQTYTTEDNKTGKVNYLAYLAENGSYYEKQSALNKIENAMTSMEQALEASAVLDAAAEKDLQDTEASVLSIAELMSSSSDKKAEAERWAMELEAKWDSLPKKQRLKAFAEQLGVDARTAYKALSDAHDIIDGKYKDDAKFYDICTRVAIGVKTGAKVGVFVCATIATGGAAAAAGGLTAAQATGIVVGGVDCCVEVARTEAKIILGDENELVQKMENSTAMQTYDAVMFLYGAATFVPKTATTGEKLLFVEDLIEKNISTYENVKVLTDETTGLVIDRIEGETKKIAVEYTRIQSENPADLAPAAESVLGAENTGILGIDPSLDDGTEAEQKINFSGKVESGDLDLAKTYSSVKDGDKSFAGKINEFKENCDEKVTYKSPKDDNTSGSGGSSGEGGGSSGGGSGSGGEGGSGSGSGSGSGGGQGGESGGGSGGSGSVTYNLPVPTYDFDEVRYPWGDNKALEEYYKNGRKVGQVTYWLDENMRYWPKTEEWECENGDWLVTEYFNKTGGVQFEWYEIGLRQYGRKYVPAGKYGCVSRKYAKHYFKTDTSSGWTTTYYDDIYYYPSGRVYKYTKRLEGLNLSYYEYSPEGRVYEYRYSWNGSNYENNYRYFVYDTFIEAAPFDPTGHIMNYYIKSGSSTEYKEYHVGRDVVYSGNQIVSETWGYFVFSGTNASDIGYNDYDFIAQ